MARGVDNNTIVDCVGTMANHLNSDSPMARVHAEAPVMHAVAAPSRRVRWRFGLS